MVWRPGIIAAADGAIGCDAFLRRELEYGRQRLSCMRASAFFFDSAMERLRLQLVVTEEGVAEPVRQLYLRAGEGVAGAAFDKTGPFVVSQPELGQRFVRQGSVDRDDLRAIAAVAIPGHRKPQAVFCFDFGAVPGGPSGLIDDERGKVADLSEELCGENFWKALRWVRASQALTDLQTAGQATARLRQEIGAFLTKLQDEFRRTHWPDPEFAYLQLVDRRRGVIRTIQGFGMPLRHQLALSHPLDSKDIQAQIVRSGEVRLIVGNDPSFDQRAFDEFRHERFVRLWLPLFPVLQSQLCAIRTTPVSRPTKALRT